MAKIAEMTTSELFVEMSDVQKDEIFRMVWASHVEEDVKSAMKDYHGHLPEDENDKQSIVEDVVMYTMANTIVTYLIGKILTTL